MAVKPGFGSFELQTRYSESALLAWLDHQCSLERGRAVQIPACQHRRGATSWRSMDKWGFRDSYRISKPFGVREDLSVAPPHCRNAPCGNLPWPAGRRPRSGGRPARDGRPRARWLRPFAGRARLLIADQENVCRRLRQQLGEQPLHPDRAENVARADDHAGTRQIGVQRRSDL